MVGFPDLFGGSREREDGVCKSWFGKDGNYTIGGFLNSCLKLGGMGDELVEFSIPEGLECRHGC